MGFSVSFLRLRDGEAIDADREGIAAFLAERGLRTDDHSSSADLLTADGQRLQLGGSATDLHLDPLDTPGVLSGGIWHATLCEEECGFVYDLCVAGGFLVCNHQGDPVFVVPAHNHDAAALEAAMPGETPVFVESGVELQAALAGGFGAFLEWKAQVLADRQPDVT